jgi:hypothetical protein
MGAASFGARSLDQVGFAENQGQGQVSLKPEQLSILAGDEDASSGRTGILELNEFGPGSGKRSAGASSGEENHQDEGTTKSPNLDYILLDKNNIQKFLTELGKQKLFAFDTETDSLDLLNNNMIGMSFSFN